jgi:hypothetical protein
VTVPNTISIKKAPALTVEDPDVVQVGIDLAANLVYLVALSC